MAKLNMEIVSKEIIKPSSPTPQQLTNYKLSLLDQVSFPYYVSSVFYYLANDVHSSRPEKSQALKHSLSKVLTRFYPLAGRFNGNDSIDCNDAGAEYVEARVHARLANFIEEPSIDEINQYFPRNPHEIFADLPLAIQINFFDCGGIAIGVCISHRVVDGTSFVNFVSAWAAATCHNDDAQILQPSYGLAYIPPPDLLSDSHTRWMMNNNTGDEKIVTKRYVFDEEKLAKLKQVVASASGSQVKNPSRVEAISALIWRHFIERIEAKSKMDNNKKTFAAIHAVNLRPIMNPPLPEHAFGNIISGAIAFATPDDDKSYHNLVRILGDSLKDYSTKHFHKMQEDGYLWDLLCQVMKTYENKEIEHFVFSSWIRFPLYEVDFDWGKPVWVAPGTLPSKNMAIFTSTRCGKGIEAWIGEVEGDELMLPCDF